MFAAPLTHAFSNVKGAPHALQVGAKLFLWQQNAGAGLADALQRGQHALPVANVEHRQPQLDVTCKTEPVSLLC